MKIGTTPLGPWLRALVAALLLAGATAPATVVPRDAAVALATIVLSIGFPVALARATLPAHAHSEGRRTDARPRRTERRRRAVAPVARARRAAPPFLLHCALLR